MARNKHPEETVQLILDVAAKLFLQKGYDNTSLQDIINETKLSKGAIYHHFCSKEDIFNIIGERIGAENARSLSKIRDNKSLNGREKLMAIFKAAIFNPNQSFIMTSAPNLMENPKFLVMQLRQTLEIVAPEYIEPILEQGMADGSINAANPHAAAEAMMVLTNIWLNPLINTSDADEMKERCGIFNKMMRGIGIDDILDDEMIEGYLNLNTIKKS